MAAVRIENDAWRDPRYVVLAKLAGLSDRDFALVLCARIWSHCTDLTVHVLDAQTVDALAGIDGFCGHMVTAKLAEEHKSGGFRIKGSRGRIEWLATKRNNAAKGGRAKASKRLASASDSLEQTPSKSLANSKQEPSEPLPSVSGSFSFSDSDSDSDSDSEREKGAGEKMFATHPAGGLAATRKPRSSARQAAPTGDTWTAYASAYRLRYGADPLRNATVNGQLSRLLQRVPGDEAPAIAQHYLSSNNARYVAAGHAVGCLLQDAEKLRTEWLTGRRTTAHEARAVDRSSGRAAQYEQVFAQLRAEDLEEATTNG